MSIVAKKIMMGSGAVALPSDSEFNRTSFLSHFDGSNDGVNNQFTDGSTSNHTITANGDVTQGSFGPFARPDGEWGVSFDGASDYLDANDGPTFGTGAFTIEFFVNHRAITGNHIMFDSRPTSTNGLYPMIWINSSGTLQYYVSTSSVISGGTMTTNTWHHVAVSRTSTSTKMFLDGTQVGSTYSDSNNYVDSGRMRVGTSAFQVSDGFHVDGVISNVRVVNSALYTSNFTAPTGKLTAVTNTKLLTCQSNRFVDNSADGLTMTPSGNTAVSAFSPFLTSSVYNPAVNGASVYLDGDGDYLTLSPQSDFAFGTGDFSVSLWVYFSAQGSFDYLIDGRNSGQTSGTWTLSINYTSGAAGKLMFASGSNAILTSDTNLNRFQWYYITVSRSGTTSRMHFNGTQVAINSSDSTNYSTSPNTSYIGTRYSNEHYFKGYMCDVRVVKGTALSSYTPPTAPLTAITNTKLLLNMADGQAIDSAAQNNLTLAGNAKISTGQAKFGNTSMVFDGTGDYVMFDTLNGPLEGLSTTSPATIEGYFNWDGTQKSGGFRTVIGINRLSDGNNTLVLYCGNSSGQGILGLRYSGGSEQVLDSSIATNTWHHFAMVLNNGSYKFQFFLNGTSVFTSTSTINVAPSDCSFVIGAEADGANAGSLGDAFTGYIDEIRVSQMARYTSNFTAPTKPFADKGQ